MATSTGPNLASAKRAIERLMDDTCTIVRDVDGVDDTDMEPATGMLVPQTAEVLYEGPCKVSAQNITPDTAVEGGQKIHPARYRGAIPIGDDPGIQIGDVWTITSSRRDPGLVGVVFRIADVEPGTFAVSRKAQLVRR